MKKIILSNLISNLIWVAIVGAGALSVILFSDKKEGLKKK